MKPVALFRCVLLAAVSSACAASAVSHTTPPQSPVSWKGCYLIQWIGPDGQQVDSLELLLEEPRPTQRQAGFREAFYYTGPIITFQEAGQLVAFSGPAWHLHADTLSIVWGILSGWSVTARQIAAGFLGTIQTYTDCCTPPFQHTYPVVGVRVACP